MEWAKLIVELVHTIAWPSVVLLLGLTFRDDFKKLLPRVVRAGPTGVEFEAQKQIVAHTYKGELRDFPGVTRTKTITLLEEKIHKLDFGHLMRRERAHFAFGARCGGEFLHCFGLAGT